MRISTSRVQGAELSATPKERISMSPIAWLTLFLLATHASAVAAQTDSNAAAAIGQVAQSWEQAAHEHRVWVRPCGKGTWMAARIVKAEVSFDVQRTQSVLRPYVGMMSIAAVTASNGHSSKANGLPDPVQKRRMICFKTQDEARAATADADFESTGIPIQWHLIYEVGASEARFARGDFVFTQQFGGSPADQPGWEAVATHPITPEGGQSAAPS